MYCEQNDVASYKMTQLSDTAAGLQPSLPNCCTRLAASDTTGSYCLHSCSLNNRFRHTEQRVPAGSTAFRPQLALSYFYPIACTEKCYH